MASSIKKTIFIQIWQGMTLPSNADLLQNLLDSRIIPIYGSAVGNLGVYLYRDDNGGLVNFLLLSLWSSHAALKGFAEPVIEKLVCSVQEKRILLAFKSIARNYEVFRFSRQARDNHLQCTEFANLDAR